MSTIKSADGKVHPMDDETRTAWQTFAMKVGYEDALGWNGWDEGKLMDWAWAEICVVHANEHGRKERSANKVGCWAQDHAEVIGITPMMVDVAIEHAIDHGYRGDFRCERAGKGWYCIGEE